MKQKKFEDLSEQYQYKLWCYKDPRVPPDWRPRTINRRRGDRPAAKKPWNMLSIYGKVYAWKSNDPRVPTGWSPPSNFLPRKEYIRKSWAELSLYSRLKCWRLGDDRVPVDYDADADKTALNDYLRENRKAPIVKRKTRRAIQKQV